MTGWQRSDNTATHHHDSVVPLRSTPMYPHVLCGICTRVPVMYRSTKKVGKRPGRSTKPASFEEVSSPEEDSF